MFNLFKRKQKQCKVVSLTEGKVFELTNVNDEIFSSKSMGEGFAFKATKTIYSPTEGIASIMPNMYHAIYITTDNGAQILIHVGLDTVKLKGKGINILVSDKQRLKCGDPIFEISEELLSKKEFDMVVPVVCTNCDDYEFDFDKLGYKKRGELILSIIKK